MRGSCIVCFHTYHVCVSTLNHNYSFVYTVAWKEMLCTCTVSMFCLKWIVYMASVVPDVCSAVQA